MQPFFDHSRVKSKRRWSRWKSESASACPRSRARCRRTRREHRTTGPTSAWTWATSKSAFSSVSGCCSWAWWRERERSSRRNRSLSEGQYDVLRMFLRLDKLNLKLPKPSRKSALPKDSTSHPRRPSRNWYLWLESRRLRMGWSPWLEPLFKEIRIIKKKKKVKHNSCSVMNHRVFRTPSKND